MENDKIAARNGDFLTIFGGVLHRGGWLIGLAVDFGFGAFLRVLKVHDCVCPARPRYTVCGWYCGQPGVFFPRMVLSWARAIAIVRTIDFADGCGETSLSTRTGAHARGRARARRRP